MSNTNQPRGLVPIVGDGLV